MQRTNKIRPVELDSTDIPGLYPKDSAKKGRIFYLKPQIQVLIRNWRKRLQQKIRRGFVRETRRETK